ncbi:hypothetical protein ASG22_16415 [Chryseobacterium sp. Leaf405]|uniref:hypothetical protein n=1 Tax=Chryseobacterium sp. Leaf405 TaxID=1736367 RepID=UPI0006F4AFF1|nr:hypothetical protein [Chryseobacterium sp. Leaf405]KQT20998.1 hypothetical protein ASG22_16415 [Chryseobacterium sp. Leaf405]
MELVPPTVNAQMNKGKKVFILEPNLFAEKFKNLVNGEDEIVIRNSQSGEECYPDLHRNLV